MSVDIIIIIITEVGLGGNEIKRTEIKIQKIHTPGYFNFKNTVHVRFGVRGFNPIFNIYQHFPLCFYTYNSKMVFELNLFLIIILIFYLRHLKKQYY